MMQRIQNMNNKLMAILVLIGILILAYFMNQTGDQSLVYIWFIGCFVGFVLQRSRFCFASAFRDLFLFGTSKTLKGILIGLLVATIGFVIIMSKEIPFPSFGGVPGQAHILPLGLSTIVGGISFGFGMVISGGCVSGSLYRLAEGYIASAVTLFGIMIGLALLFFSWNWWWDRIISYEPQIWLPEYLGYGFSLVITLLILFGLFVLVIWIESRSSISFPDLKENEFNDTFKSRLETIFHSIFVRGWSPLIGGAMLGGLGVLLYMVHMPLGVTGELGRWVTITVSTIGITLPELKGLSDLGGCSGQSSESGIFGHTFAVTVGVIAGSLFAAMGSHEFKLRFPREKRRYIQALIGGIIMGYGAGLAIGCTIGAFFSSIPSLSLSGWLFGISLAIGAFFGVKIIKKLA